MVARLPLVFFCIALATGLSPASRLVAKDYFLTIGGGSSPTGNQVSLEKNILMFQALLSEQYDSAPHDIFFSDGNDPGRDLQFIDPKFEIPKVNLLLAQVMRQSKYLGYQYRSHKIPKVTGKSSRASLQRWFREKGAKLESGDRLIIYVTAHGGRSSDKKSPNNTKLYLWNKEQIQMKEFAEHLNKLPKDVSVVLVMVQCYSGGFANVIFKDGESNKGVASRVRCGFFASLNNRPAAGCTPDIDEGNYEEYSSYFWAALRGKMRTGVAIQKPDYDRNGMVSFEEAHAFAVLRSPTIDIPVKTSGALLRKFSKLGSKKKPELFSAQTSYDQLFKKASPAQQAILQGLSAELKFNRSDRATEASALASKLEKQRKRLESERKKKDSKSRTVTGEIAKAIKNRWPELNNRWDPQVANLLQGEAEALVKFIESHPRFGEMTKLRKQSDKLSDERLSLEKKWCKCQRLLRTLQNVALAANLPKVASPEVQSRYETLIAAERGSFGAKSEKAKVGNHKSASTGSCRASLDSWPILQAL